MRQTNLQMISKGQRQRLKTRGERIVRLVGQKNFVSLGGSLVGNRKVISQLPSDIILYMYYTKYPSLRIIALRIIGPHIGARWHLGAKNNGPQDRSHLDYSYKNRKHEKPKAKRASNRHANETGRRVTRWHRQHRTRTHRFSLSVATYM